MRLRNNPKAKELIENHRDVVIDLKEKVDLKTLFASNQPVRMEIGMGKGDFIINKALQHPEINFIGVEKYDSVLYVALKKYLAMEQKPSNLRFICFDATNLLDYFEKNSLQKIYLNFSDPWPKAKHAKRRLTYRSYLAIYQELLSEDGDIEFKTDNRGLFEYSLISMNQYAAMGLVLTAKSIARYDKITKDEKFAEYYLLGTLISTACVVVCKMIVLR